MTHHIEHRDWNSFMPNAMLSFTSLAFIGIGSLSPARV